MRVLRLQSIDGNYYDIHINYDNINIKVVTTGQHNDKSICIKMKNLSTSEFNEFVDMVNYIQKEIHEEKVDDLKKNYDELQKILGRNKS